MLIEAKAAFYNEATGAVQPWRDIEVTDTVGEGLIGEGLAVEIAEGGGGGDFTVAEMNLVVTGSGGASIDYPLIDDSSMTLSIANEAGENTYGVVLYKNQSAGFDVWDLDHENTYPASAMTGTGDIEIDESGYVTISGDCTLTVNTGS